MATNDYHSVDIINELVYSKKISIKHSITKIAILSFMIMQSMTVIIQSKYVKDWIYDNILKDPKIREKAQTVYHISDLICAILIFIISCYMLYDIIFPSNRLHGIYDHKQLQSKAQCDNIIANMDNDDLNMAWYKKLGYRMKFFHRLDTVLIEYLNTVYKQYIKMSGNIFSELESIDDNLSSFKAIQTLWNTNTTAKLNDLTKQMQDMRNEQSKQMQDMQDKLDQMQNMYNNQTIQMSAMQNMLYNLTNRTA